MAPTVRKTRVGPRAGPYEPFEPGPFGVGVRTFETLDKSRNRRFPCEIWYPAAATANRSGPSGPAEPRESGGGPTASPASAIETVRDSPAEPGTYPLVVFIHHSGGSRTSATYLCTHLSTHGYIVAAMDHSEVVAPELARKDGESAAERDARIAGWIASRPPDVRFLMDHLLGERHRDLEATPDTDRVGVVGYSFGGWTALAAAQNDERIRTVVALAPGGSSNPRPGIIPATLTFRRSREVPVMYLVAEQDTCLPLAGMYELFDRTPGPKRMVVLRHADHMHFLDDVEREHEAMRAVPATDELAWIAEMRPIGELCSPEHAHLFVRGLALAHLDATLRSSEPARRFLRGDIAAELAERGSLPPPGALDGDPSSR